MFVIFVPAGLTYVAPVALAIVGEAVDEMLLNVNTSLETVNGFLAKFVALAKLNLMLTFAVASLSANAFARTLYLPSLSIPGVTFVALAPALLLKNITSFLALARFLAKTVIIGITRDDLIYAHIKINILCVATSCVQVCNTAGTIS